jgi:preprotein translocase subunit SecG
MIPLITTLHIIVCMFLIIVVLLQHGKSADIAATFGGQNSQTAFGPRGAATLLSKATTWSAIIFMLTSVTLSILVKRSGGSTGSVMETEKPAATQPAPPSATPTPQPQEQQPAEKQPPAQPK